MKLPPKTIKAASYVSGIFAIASAGLLVLLLILSICGLIHPRVRYITLYTENVSKVYDGTPLRCSEPIPYGTPLYDGHQLVVLDQPEITLVGEIQNAPVYRILDNTGADVTDKYEITENFGTLAIIPRPITLHTSSKTQRYNGLPLSSDEQTLTQGNLISGHKLVLGNANALVEPGVIINQYDYRIEDEDGINRADQYDITEKFGDLTILAIPIYLRSDSAQKIYDGTPLQADGWKMEAGNLLEGHTLFAETTAVIQEVGSCSNEIHAKVKDSRGTDMSHLYSFTMYHGTLDILPIPLTFTTGSAEKIYDGTPISCEDWSLTAGKLESGASIVPSAPIIHNGIGAADNVITFRILDRNGKDITKQYDIQCNYGTLNIQPRPLTVRTGSAEKVYDGDALTCNEFSILSGSLLPQDELTLNCASFGNIGYSENWVLSCVIIRKENGIQTDVTNHYRIAFQYGVLRITAN